MNSIKKLKASDWLGWSVVSVLLLFCILISTWLFFFLEGSVIPDLYPIEKFPIGVIIVVIVCMLALCISFGFYVKSIDQKDIKSTIFKFEIVGLISLLSMGTFGEYAVANKNCSIAEVIASNMFAQLSLYFLFISIVLFVGIVVLVLRNID